MFSVGAEPFNSRDRQLYGGWTLSDTNGIQNPVAKMWAQKKYLEMLSKYGPSPGHRRVGTAGLYHYRQIAKANPGLKKALAKFGRKMTSQAVPPMLMQGTRDAMMNTFRNLSLSDVMNGSTPAQASLGMLNKGPYNFPHGTDDFFFSRFLPSEYTTAAARREALKQAYPNGPHPYSMADIAGTEISDNDARSWLAEYAGRPRAFAAPSFNIPNMVFQGAPGAPVFNGAPGFAAPVQVKMEDNPIYPNPNAF